MGPAMTFERIRLLDLVEWMTAAQLELQGVSTARALACDFYVKGVEKWPFCAGAYRQGRIVSIDHHADDPRMARSVSSANLAIEWIEAGNMATGADIVVITHTDCDSILSSGIVSGVLAPRQEYGEAAIAADHTGAENAIADLLQGLDHHRDLGASFGNLRRLEDGAPLEGIAQRAVDSRRRKRELAARAVADGTLRVDGPLAFGILEESVDGEFFPALLPDVTAILTAVRHPLDRTRWVMKLRLGLAAPAGLTLPRLGIEEFDVAFGGRWNAGSNRRGGGTAVLPEVYAGLLRRRVDAVLGMM
jgi:hypothetical protein